MCPNPEATRYMQRYRHCQAIDTGGNTILDAVRLAGADPTTRDESRPYLVASLHRFQNLYDGKRLDQLVALIEAIAQRYPVHFVLHPATRKRLAKAGLTGRLEAAPGVLLSPRLGYREFLRLAAGAACVLTDGGSNQEELAALGIPTIVMRERTERPDGVGENAVMEADIPGGVAAYVLAGGFEGLRRTQSVGGDLGPSQMIAEYLAEEA
jgi:UDP-N-acetylglucosamine 2-epimerase (non-hydrolysing)